MLDASKTFQIEFQAQQKVFSPRFPKNLLIEFQIQLLGGQSVRTVLPGGAAQLQDAAQPKR